MRQVSTERGMCCSARRVATHVSYCPRSCGPHWLRWTLRYWLRGVPGLRFPSFQLSQRFAMFGWWMAVCGRPLYPHDQALRWPHELLWSKWRTKLPWVCTPTPHTSTLSTHPLIICFYCHAFQFYCFLFIFFVFANIFPFVIAFVCLL